MKRVKYQLMALFAYLISKFVLYLISRFAEYTSVCRYIKSGDRYRLLVRNGIIKNGAHVKCPKCYGTSISMTNIDRLGLGGITLEYDYRCDNCSYLVYQYHTGSTLYHYDGPSAFEPEPIGALALPMINTD